MVKKSKTKLMKDIKTKLMAAIAMLLVSSIMMVSSTYAWFTLSTAPEVTGINTAVGANGNLEMALVPTDGDITKIQSAVGDSIAAVNTRNTTWGNLVDVSDNTYYGMDQITLYPSQLNQTAEKDAAGNVIKLPSGALLETPVYGADGRISQMSANAQTGIYQTIAGNSAFFPEDGIYGVRAVGTASGLSARELAYRNARAAANDARALAANKAAASLSANGNNLAGIAVKLAAGSGATYTNDDLTIMGQIIADLTAENGVLDQIETAYMQYLLALATSNKVPSDDVWPTVKTAVETPGATLDDVLAKLPMLETAVPELMVAINAYRASVTKVADAQTQYNALLAEGKNSYTWDDLSPILSKLANPETMLINDKTVDSIKADKQPLIDDVLGGKGITVSIASGGGVYADVADHCGDYTASVRIDGVEFQGITIKTNATMKTKSNMPVAYLVALGTTATTAGVPSTTTEALPMTDIFGYIIDLAFRTNAADSNLLLQAEAVDRIYEGSTGAEIKDNDGNVESTMGHGASMTFQSTNASFSNDQVKNLMKSIRIVFFDPATREVYATAKLDVETATVGVDGVTAKMYLYELVAAGVEYQAATAEQKTDATTTLYTLNAETGNYEAVADKTQVVEGTDYYVQVQVAAGERKLTDMTIMSLTQNTAKALSVLVYLDGNNVTNADVAATGSSSMKGIMNLQFSSSATLTPMEYTPLMGQQTAEETNP